MVNQGEDLTELPGVGDDLAGKIREIVTTGHSTLLGELCKQTPPVLKRLLAIPGLGPKRVQALYRDSQIRTVEQLARAARCGRIHELPGFGEKTEQHILQAIATRAADAGRVRLALAAQYAEPLVDYLKQAPGVKSGRGGRQLPATQGDGRRSRHPGHCEPT